VVFCFVKVFRRNSFCSRSTESLSCSGQWVQPGEHVIVSDGPNETYMSDLMSPFVEDHRRLRVGNETVGYSKSVGRVEFFSRDRYAWTGERLDYTHSDIWSGYVDKNRTPVYLNDLVLLKEGVFSEDPVQAVVLGSPKQGLFVQSLQTGEKLPLEDPFAPALGPNAIQVIGQAYRHSGLWEQLQAESVGTEEEGFPEPSRMAGAHLVLWQTTFLVAFVGLDWKLGDGVGPLSGCFGIWLGALMGLWRHRASQGPVLSRARVRHLAVRSASGMSAVGCVGYVVIDAVGMTQDALPQFLWWAPLLMGFTLGLVSLISVLTGGDTLVTLYGGYDGEPEKKKRR